MSGREASEPDADSPQVRHLMTLSARLAGLTTTLDDWLAMPPITLDTGEETIALPLEEAFERESGALRAVCNRPYTRLRTIEEPMPASRVRSIAPGAVTRLAAHPEDWASHTLAGVRPHRLLARRSEEDPDIYENRIAVGVLHLMRSHLQQRIAKVSALNQMVSDVQQLRMPSEKSAWRARRDLAGLLRNIDDSDRHRAAAEARLGELESALVDVETMLSSPLARAIGHRGPPPGDLHATNLLTADPGYRRVARLWEACTANVGAPAEPGAERRQETDVAFRHFTALLVLLACRLLGATPDADQPAPTPGTTSWFRLRGAELAVEWTPAGDFVLRWRGSPVLRVLPVMTDLCTAPDTASVAAAISAVREARPYADGVRDLVVYPGSLPSRQKAAPEVAAAAYAVGRGTVGGSGGLGGSGGPGAVDVAPLSPLEIFSVSRLVRAMHWATLGADARGYPRLVPISAGERSALAACDWVEPRAHGVAVVRPPLPQELDRLPVLLTPPHPRQGGRRAAESEKRRIQALCMELEDAGRATALLAVCPVCAKTDPHRPTSFKPRSGNLFAAVCSSCQTRWELRRCTSCDDTFPLLHPHGHATSGTVESELDRRLGGALLAVPCWSVLHTEQAVCPTCGACGQTPPASECPRGCRAGAGA
ncbi:DUF2357 domain-containing protein [Streptomyces sp. NPDC056500]|uniref:DUF2357 domain-containing protein n=1 Tax=Streptomyces sp. NPDC056500 TaxID=3345840 RepID=UPI0036AA30B0